MADDGPGIPEALMQSMLRSIISEHTAAVGDILECLSNQDSRFIFIKESFDEFLDGQYGFREFERLSLPGTNDGKYQRKYLR